MVRRYKAKGVVRNYSDEKLQEAVSMVRTGRISARQAAARWNIPRATLGDYLRGESIPGCSIGRQPVLKPHVERALVEKVQEAATGGFGISRLSLMAKTGASNVFVVFLRVFCSVLMFYNSLRCCFVAV